VFHAIGFLIRFNYLLIIRREWNSKLSQSGVAINPSNCRNITPENSYINTNFVLAIKSATKHKK